MRNTWNVTYEIVTPESAEDGDAAEHGFLIEDASFRDAIDAWSHGGAYTEADSCPISLAYPPRWFTVQDDPSYRDGSQESRSLHIPDHVTPASRVRLARVFRCYGLR